MSRKGVLRKKPAGWRAMARKHDARVLRMGKPLAAFSMMALGWSVFLNPGNQELETRNRVYRSMTVITGQVRIPAVAALAASMPRRGPSRLAFHVDEGVDDARRSLSRARTALAFAFAVISAARTERVEVWR